MDWSRSPSHGGNADNYTRSATRRHACVHVLADDVIHRGGNMSRTRHGHINSTACAPSVQLGYSTTGGKTHCRYSDPTAATPAARQQAHTWNSYLWGPTFWGLLRAPPPPQRQPARQTNLNQFIASRARRPWPGCSSHAGPSEVPARLHPTTKSHCCPSEARMPHPGRKVPSSPHLVEGKVEMFGNRFSTGMRGHKK